MHLSLLLTEQCDWKCDYCVSPTIKSPKSTNIDILKKHLPYISKVLKKLDKLKLLNGIDIQGGEVGLLDLDTLRYLFDEINQPLIVSTNGKFLKKKYHQDPILKKNIHSIYYHIYPDPTDSSGPYNIFTENNLKTNKGIVGKDPKALVEFVKKHPETQFNYVALESKIDVEEEISLKGNQYLYDELKNTNNVDSDCIKLIGQKIKNSKKLKINPQELCPNNNDFLNIDLANERIFLCIRSYDQSYIALNEKNLNMAIKRPAIELFSNFDRCKACIRLSIERSNYTKNSLIHNIKMKYFI